MSLLWGLQNIQQRCFPLCSRQFSSNFDKFELWKVNMILPRISDFQSMCFGCCAGFTPRSRGYVQKPGKEENKHNSPLLITRNSGNFLQCFMNKWSIQASCFTKHFSCHSSHLTKFSIKVGGKIMRSRWQISRATGPY